MPAPLAYFLTWTTYGSWLPGDVRMWVHHSQSGKDVPYKAPDPNMRQTARRLMKQPAVKLNHDLRRIVEYAIRESCRHRSWQIHALSVLSNHVHLVVTTDDITPERVMAYLKAWASKLMNESVHADGNRRWWTRHGSTRYVNSQNSLNNAIKYVLNQ